MKSDQHRLASVVNASGFAFQIAVEAAVEATSATHRWSTHVREYPWNSERGGGFVDLVLRRGPFYLVVECKRTRGGEWVFLMPNPRQMSRTHATVRWTNTVPHRAPLSEWGDTQIDPGSPESEFCVVRGQGEGDRPMLERLAGPLLNSTEALAADLLSIHEQIGSTCVLMPVIVTTARLFVCQFKPSTIDLLDGDIQDGTFSEVPSVRFRKSLASGVEPIDFEPDNLGDLQIGSVRTLFVVNAAHFVTWLADFESRDPSGSAPWELARGRANAMGM